jgi:K+-transporting ATPase c subunit
MKSKKQNQETSLVDATSFAANRAQKLVNANESSISNSMTLGANQTSSNYAHGRNMANSSSFRPPMELQNSNESGFYGGSNSLLTNRLAF